MNRIKGLIILIGILVITTGCSTLKCEIKTNNYNSIIKIKFENNKPTTYNFKDEMLFSNNLNTDSELYYHTKYTSYSYLISDNYARITNHNNKVKLKINYDFTKDKSQGENKLLISKKDTIKTATQKIEKSGYTCK